MPPNERVDWQKTFDRATALIDGVLRELPEGKKTPARLALIEAHGRLRDDEAIVAVLDAALGETVEPRDRALLDLERGKALIRLGRTSDALKSLDMARKAFTKEEPEHDLALLYTAEARARDADSRCVDDCAALIERNGRMAPLAHLVLARFERDARRGDWMTGFLMGLQMLEDPDLFDETGFDFGSLYEELRAEWEAETDDATLLRFVPILEEAERIFPDRPEIAGDRGRVWRRAGALIPAPAGPAGGSLAVTDTRTYVVALERQWRGGGTVRRDLSDAADRSKARTERYGFAADAFVAVAYSPWARGGQAGASVRDAADACLAGGLFPRAAALFRRANELQSSLREENLYWHAVSLMRAGILGGAPEEPGALESFEEYFHAARPGNPRFSLALLNRGQILASLDRRDDALEEFDRVMGDPALGIGPQTDVWAEALLSRGRTLLDLAEAAGDEGWERAYRGDAARALGQYLDRYSDDPARATGAVEVNYLLARSEMGKKNWKGALARLDAIEAVSEVIPGVHPLVRETWFLKGDLLLNEGLYREAQVAYDRAYRRTITSPERLRGLIGRARANLRLGNEDEALRDYENSLSIYNAVKEDLDASLAGFGARFFNESLKELKRELP